MSYYLVLDTMTNRVIKFANTELAAAGKNTYLAQILSLPPELTEENSWQYKLVGGALKVSRTQTPVVVGKEAVLRETKHALRRTVMEKAQREFNRKVPLAALTYIASLDAARKWIAKQPLEPIELRVIPSVEKAEEFMALHYANLEQALKATGPMDSKLNQIGLASTAEELEKIIP
jgi:hypothetical protein